MKLISYKIQNDEAVGYERENSTIHLVVNQEGEESLSFAPKRVKLHNCSIRNLESLSDNYNEYFSVFDSSEGKNVIIESLKYQSIRITKEND
jgi:predicted double-glycine peptidase